MHCRFSQMTISCLFVAALTSIVLCSACDNKPSPRTQSSPSDTIYSFTGTWTAIGRHHTMQLGPGRQATLFNYTGSILLGGPQKLKTGFKAEVIGITDNATGMQGRCVWTDETGDKVFSEISSPAATADIPIDGRFIGGTGRYRGASGAYSFKWQRLVNNEDGEVSGRVVDLKGWVRFEPSTANPAPPVKEGQF